MRKIIQKILSSTITAVLFCTIPALLAITTGNGSTHQEANAFLIVYNLDLPLLKLIFDPLRTDWQCFQARELSYLIDFADARFIAWSIRHQMAHFFSLSSIFFAVAGAGVLHRKLKSFYPDRKWFDYLLPALLYSFCCCCYFNFFRSAKPAAAFGTLILFTYLAEVIKFPEKMHSWRRHIFPGIVLLLLPYFDRQGFFAVFTCASGALLLLFFSAICPAASCFSLPEAIKKPLFAVTATAVFSVLLSILYNFVIAPEIIFALHGYYPSYAYQKLPPASLTVITDGFCFLFGNIGFIFTSITGNSSLLAGLLTTAILFLCARNNAAKEKSARLTVAALAGTLAAVYCASVLMIIRHPALMWPDVMYGSYFQCFGAVLCGIFSLILLDTPPDNFRYKLLLGLFALAVSARVIPFDFPSGSASGQRSHLAFHAASSVKTVELLNNPESKIDHPLPFSSLQLVYFFRNHPQLLDFTTTRKTADYKVNR